MSNLLKSKFLIGVMTAASLVAGVVAVTPAIAAASSCTITATLRVGSKGAEVKCLQAAVGVSADGSFGPKTAAAVKVWQTSKGLTADGVFGKNSRAQFVGGTVATSNCPAGQFNPLTGLPCGSTTTLPPGCTSTSGYSSSVANTPCNGGVVVNNGGPLSVSLAGDNPAAGNLIQGQATADLAHFAFSGSGTLTQITLQRTGISDNSVFPNVYLYNGNTRLTSSASINILGQINFNGLNIAVNGSLNLSVRADIAASGNDSTVTVTLTGYAVSGGGSATSVNLAGNMFYISSGSGILSTVTVGANQWAGTTPLVSAGTSGYSLWSAGVTVSLHSVWLKAANFQFIGSAPSNAFGNLGLFANGVKVATSTGINAQGQIAFDLSGTPYSMTTGTTTLEVRGDIVNGSSRSAQLSLQNASDLMVTDSQVGVNVSVLSQGSAVFSQNNGGLISISAGSLVASVDPAFSSITNVTGGATNVVIGGFKLASYGEDVKINTINVTPVVTARPGGLACATGTAGDSALSNVTLYYNGGPIGSSKNAVFTNTGTNCNITTLVFTPGSNLTIPGGTSASFQVHADLVTTGGTNYTSGTIGFNAGSSSDGIYIPAGDYQGMTSNTTNVSAYPFPSSNALTVQTGSLTIGQNTGYLGQTLSPNTSGAKIGSFTIQNKSNSEGVQVNSLTVNLCSTTGITSNACTSAFGTLINISTLSLSGIPGTQPTPVGQPTASNVFSTNFTIPAGGSQTVDVLANLGSTNTGNLVVDLGVLGVGSNSRVPLAPSAVAGQTMALGVGTVNVPTLVGSSSTNAQFISSAGTGATNAAQETYNFVATQGTANIVGLKFAALDGRSGTTAAGNGGTTDSQLVANFSTATLPETLVVAAQTNYSGSTCFDATHLCNYLVTTTGVYGGTNAVVTGFYASNVSFHVTAYQTPMVAGGTTVGATDGVPLTIYSLATSGVTGVALNSTGVAVGSASFNNGIAYLSSINGGSGALVPNNPSGVTLPVFMSFGPVNTNGGVASASTGQVILEYVQYQTGSTTSYLAPAVGGTTLTLVGSKPTITLNPTTQALSNGTSALLGTITISADNGGDVAISEIPLTVTINVGSGGTLSGSASVATNSLKLTDTNGVTLANFTPLNTAGTTSTVTAKEIFGDSGCSSSSTCVTNHYRISAGGSKTFEIHADLSANTFGTSATVNVSLGTNTGFAWDDINGANVGSVKTTDGTISTGLTGAGLYNYPNGSVSAHN